MMSVMGISQQQAKWVPIDPAKGREALRVRPD